MRPRSMWCSPNPSEMVLGARGVREGCEYRAVGWGFAPSEKGKAQLARERRGFVGPHLWVLHLPGPLQRPSPWA